MEKKTTLIIGCLIAALGLVSYFVLKPKPISIDIDKYVEDQNNLCAARKEADSARKAWESQREERAKAEKDRLKGLDIPDLSKNAVAILARAENPQFIVNKAIVETEKELGVTITRPPWSKGSDPDKHLFWSIVYRETIDEKHDWWIEQNNVFGQYRLIGNPDQKIYFSIKKEPKLKSVLINIVLEGNRKSFYQVVSNDVDNPEIGCEILSLDDAMKIFPETLNLAEGFYAKHPYNPYALVPLDGFHARLAMDKITECVVLLGRMGAKSVRVSMAKGEKSDIEGGAGASVYGYNAKINSALAKAMKSKMELKVLFSGKSNIDIPPTLLENSIWHKSDPQLNGILQTILSGNTPKEWSIVEEDASDFNFDFKTAAGILRIFEADLKAKFEKSRETQREFHVTF